jgi:dTDP-4-dehydrorhamnose reductase
MRVLVLGASGMLGNAVFRTFLGCDESDAWGTIRDARAAAHFTAAARERLLSGTDVLDPDVLVRVFDRVRPQVVVNCVGLVKQLAEANDPLVALPVNALLPHRLARLCGLVGARLIHISTDCVFSGRRGGYRETDEADALDLYGRSKLLGEVDYPEAVTLRTSIIGHELSSAHGLVGWFLGQQHSVRGYTEAFFSGLPTCEMAQVIWRHVLPRPHLRGVYHVAAERISKYDLLRLVNIEYAKGLQIHPDDALRMDRSLDASRFREATGYVAPDWPRLIADMHAFG